MKKKLVIIVCGILGTILLFSLLFYNIGLSAVSKESNEVEFVIEEGSTYSRVINKLKNEKLIKNKYVLNCI